jgi:hypothetical protein
MKSQEQKSEEKIILSFSFGHEEDSKILDSIDDALKFINELPYGKPMSKSDFMKKFFKVPSKKDMLKLKKSTITNEQKINLWVTAYNKSKNTSITKEEFIVNVLPKMGKRTIKNLEKTGEIIQ